MLARRSRELLELYRSGKPAGDDCPLWRWAECGKNSWR